MSTKIEGVYFNTSPDPVFLESTLVGGHEFVYIDGYVRLPGNFIKIDDPQDDPNAPESFQIAYAKLTEKAENDRKKTHANSANSKVNIVTDDSDDKAEKKTTRSSRRGKRDSSADNEDDQ